MSENAGQPDTQAALPQTEEWSNAPTEDVGLSDDQAPLDDDTESSETASDGEVSQSDVGGGESSPPGTPDEPTAENKAANDSARQNADQTGPTFGESVEDL